MSSKLLVSVRTPLEAALAAQARVDIIDVKEPKAGALGMASVEVIESCLQQVQSINPLSQTSLACGEVIDWERSRTPAGEIRVAPEYLKLGLAGLGNDSNWEQRWLKTRTQISGCFDPSTQPQWIAVVYADTALANSPAPDEIIQAAASTGCVGLLFDTFSKQEGTFADWVSPDQLGGFLHQIHTAGLFCAVAGRLTEQSIIDLQKLPVDIFGVRSAVCHNGVREAEVSREKIHQLLRLIKHGTVTIPNN